MESKIYINDSDRNELSCKKDEESRKLLWIDISNFSELWQFLMCTFVVFIFFIPYGYLQVIFTYYFIYYICIPNYFQLFSLFLGSHFCY